MKKGILLVLILTVFIAICTFTACKDTSSDNVNDGGQHVHSLTTQVIPSTCTIQGRKTSTCECGYVFTEVLELDSENHQFGAWSVVTPSTCTTNGSQVRTCACGAQETGSLELDANNHETNCSHSEDSQDPSVKPEEPADPEDPVDPEQPGTDPVDPEQPGTDPEEPALITITKTMEEMATLLGWEDATKYLTFNLDEVITVTSVGSNNTGKYYDSDKTYRLYQMANSTLTIEAMEGYEIVSVKITYNYANAGTLLLDETAIESKSVVDVNDTGITFGVGSTSDATNGQVKIKSIEVVYQLA